MNKIVLITGASGGFGQEFTKNFHKDGCKLILCDLNEEQVKTSLAKLSNENPGLLDNILGIIEADLASKEGAQKVFDEASQLSDHIDILVNNAGIAIAGNFIDNPIDKIETLMQLNTMAPMRLAHLFLPKMKERGSGHIVNVSSIAGHIPSPGLTTYCSSKFALRAFGLSLAREIDQYGLHVTNVYPFFTNTPLLRNSKIYGKKEEALVPDFLADSAEDVIKSAMRAIHNKELEVFPSTAAKISSFVQWAAPGLMPGLGKVLMP